MSIPIIRSPNRGPRLKNSVDTLRPQKSDCRPLVGTGEVQHLADSGHSLPYGQILGVDGLAMVLAPVKDVIPATVQLRERQAQLYSTQ